MSSQASLKTDTVICKQNYQNHSEITWEHIILLVLSVGFILAALVGVWAFSKKIQLFPLKGRAPRFALLQMIYFILLCFIPLLVEGLVASEVNWEGQTQTYLSQVFLKALLSTVRTWVYLAYLFRTLIIYANWRVPFEKLKSQFWKVAGDELSSLLVGDYTKSGLYHSAVCDPLRFHVFFQ